MQAAWRGFVMGALTTTYSEKFCRQWGPGKASEQGRIANRAPFREINAAPGKIEKMEGRLQILPLPLRPHCHPLSREALPAWNSA